MPKLNRWVVHSAFQHFKENPDFLAVNFRSMNLSGQSVVEPEFLDYMITQFGEFDIDPSKICFELTETAAISNLGRAIKLISTLKGFGCSFSLDDFGSGFSSFAYLKNLPVDYLKIDGLFVRDILEDPVDLAMVKCIKEISQLTGMKTIAEFVENEEIRDALKSMGIDDVQGYGVGRPALSTRLLHDRVA